MERLCLNGNWNGECFFENGESDFTFSASVPGCVHTDLMGSRIPKNIYYRDNADACQWIEDRDWKFTKSFRLDAIPSKAKLVFEGLDTYADIYLNDKLLGSSENMFIRHTFDVSALVCEGENTLSVFIHSPIKKTEGLEKRRGAFTTERMHTRRLQCTYGWDWVARLVTAGIWRDVYLDFAEGFAVSNVYVTTEAISPNYAQILIEAETENYADGGTIDISITDPDGKKVYSHRLFCREPSIRQYVDIRDANLWFPLGYGSQPLYTLKIGNIEQKFGIRTVLIEQIPDEVGSPYYRKCLEIKDSVSGNIYDKNTEFSGFRLIVNGVPIMCKGANWVPCEPFPSAETDEKITTLLTLAKEAGLNMLRIWGGGIFEKQHFYNECDRLGILVTQDFLMACGHYPEEKEEFIAELRKEAEFAALELRNHPCLMWWSGDNENAIMGNDEARDYQGRAAIHRGIMPVLAKLDNQRRFLLSSPYGGNLYASKTVGTTHNTQYLGDSIFPYILDSDMKDYKEFFSTLLARFIAEEPTLGAVSLPSLKKFMTEKDIFESTEMWDYHMKGNPDLWFTLFDLLQTFARKVFGEFENGADRFFKMKYNQFEWVRITLENIRRNLGFTNGLIYWMWNDCWPASAGWAFVDYYCLPKASYYSFKRCASELIASIDRKDEYEIYLCNDGLDEKQVKITLSYVQNGLSHPLCTLNAAIAPQTSEKIFALPLT
ncbi:MAG: hypothetical protein II350_02055, partial [Clostridia bacterium]|nr:hypothetical protein [Clostridia bacterium]